MAAPAATAVSTPVGVCEAASVFTQAPESGSILLVSCGFKMGAILNRGNGNALYFTMSSPSGSLSCSNDGWGGYTCSGSGATFPGQFVTISYQHASVFSGFPPLPQTEIVWSTTMP